MKKTAKTKRQAHRAKILREAKKLRLSLIDGYPIILNGGNNRMFTRLTHFREDLEKSLTIIDKHLFFHWDEIVEQASARKYPFISADWDETVEFVFERLKLLLGMSKAKSTNKRRNQS